MSQWRQAEECNKYFDKYMFMQRSKVVEYEALKWDISIAYVSWKQS